MNCFTSPRKTLVMSTWTLHTISYNTLISTVEAYSLTTRIDPPLSLVSLSWFISTVVWNTHTGQFLWYYIWNNNTNCCQVYFVKKHIPVFVIIVCIIYVLNSCSKVFWVPFEEFQEHNNLIINIYIFCPEYSYRINIQDSWQNLF
jgi:hypothetical protein